MMKSITLFTIATILCLCGTLHAQQAISITAKDGLAISAYLYETNTKFKGVMLLCHQAGYSKGEYIETAKRFQDLGYTCLAIDQRSGNEVNGIINETAQCARLQNLPTNYIAAQQDIESAFSYLRQRYNQRIIIIGSSYSASLAIKVACDSSAIVRACIAFSPGEYFDSDTLLVSKALSASTVQTFITCSSDEIAETQDLITRSGNKIAVLHTPVGAGVHGSRALWKKLPKQKKKWRRNMDYEHNWTALLAFLSTVAH
jgi:dienelactone hydrolase